jgi:hypothetical protein
MEKVGHDVIRVKGSEIGHGPEYESTGMGNLAVLIEHLMAAANV